MSNKINKNRLRSARNESVSEIRAQAVQTLERNGTRLNIILAFFAVASMYIALYAIADLIIYLFYYDSDMYAVIDFALLLLPALILAPVFAGFRYMLLNTVRYGRTDLRDLFIMYSSSYYHHRGMCSSLPMVIRMYVSVMLIFSAFYIGEGSAVPRALIFIIGLALLPLWLYLTRAWAVNAYLQLPDVVRGGSIAHARTAAKKKYYAHVLMGGTMNSYSGKLLLSAITLQIYGIAAAYPEILMSRAFCADRTINLVNNERKGQEND